MSTLSSSVFYILTGWTCVFNLYKFFYNKKLNEHKKDINNVNKMQIDSMTTHYKKADKLGKVFLSLWCLSAVWYFFNLNV